MTSDSWFCGPPPPRLSATQEQHIYIYIFIESFIYSSLCKLLLRERISGGRWLGDTRFIIRQAASMLQMSEEGNPSKIMLALQVMRDSLSLYLSIYIEREIGCNRVNKSDASLTWFQMYTWNQHLCSAVLLIPRQEKFKENHFPAKPCLHTTSLIWNRNRVSYCVRRSWYSHQKPKPSESSWRVLKWIQFLTCRGGASALAVLALIHGAWGSIMRVSLAEDIHPKAN